MKKCRHCGAENGASASVCAECGLPFSPSPIGEVLTRVVATLRGRLQTREAAARVNAKRRRAIAFAATLACFAIANLVTVHVRSDGGLLEGLGIVYRTRDGIRRIGFPFQFFEEGGYSYRYIFSLSALLADVALAIACAVAVTFAAIRITNVLKDGQPPPAQPEA